MAYAIGNPAIRRAFARQSFPRAFSTSRLLRTNASFFANEPSGPTIKTPIPGPKNKEAMVDLDKIFDIRSCNMLANYDASVGN